jgi:ABC-type uncharacterized transport system permease subunit
VTEPLSYATPDRAKTPLIAWLSIGLAILAFFVDLFAIYAVRSQSKVYVSTTGGAGVVLSPSPPAWIHLLQVLAIGLPLVGLVLAIVAAVRVRSNKSAAIVGIVLNALMLGVLLLIA